MRGRGGLGWAGGWGVIIEGLKSGKTEGEEEENSKLGIIYLSVCLSIFPIYLSSVSVCLYLFVCVVICLPLSVYIPTYLSVCLPINLSVRMSVCMSVYPFIYLSVFVQKL